MLMNLAFSLDTSNNSIYKWSTDETVHCQSGTVVTRTL